ncbi:carboxypeptidase-like regulatory domain-containing protein [Pendulispora brunnea]|uniref:Carboxypeptidase-like regulatory domain-containing protein n=1 Tax=Pendulispora brunnea TaxID=2905690 RepID=A0ABZ2K381_9BACT
MDPFRRLGLILYRARHVRFACVCALVFLSSTGLARHAYAQLRVHVRGAAKIDARAARQNGALVLSGTLKDDLGQALAGETVSVSLARVRGAGDRRTEEALGLEGEQRPTGCEDPPTRPPENTAGALKVDDAGRFCARFPLSADHYVAHLATQGSSLLEGAKTDLEIDLAKRSISLRFDPAPRSLMIDANSLAMDAVATVDETEGGSLAGRMLALRNEKDTALGYASTNAAGRVHFVLDPKKLGAPGPGELRLVYAGDVDTSAGLHIIPIERHTHVTLSVDVAGNATITGIPEDGIPIDVHAKIRGAGDATGGSVEVRLGEHVVGAAPVEKGVAHVVSSFVSPETSSAMLSVRYLPDAPWYEPDEPLSIMVALQGPSPLRQLPLAIAGIAVAAFLVLGRLGRRATRTLPPREAKAPAERPAEARLEVVRPASAAHPRRWTGRVIDAHHGTPITDVRVVIEHATFGQRELAASCVTDDEGRFTLDANRLEQDARLVAEGPFHSAFRQKLPPAGEIEISLVSRKRALLDRLIAWARVRGRPFDQRPEPTPGHVRDVAGGDFATARWAEAVEHAAFSADDVDARAEEDIEKMAPTAAPASKGRAVKLDIPPAQQTQVNPAPSLPRHPPRRGGN